MDDLICCEKCICHYVCSDNVALYSSKCMQTMRVFNSKGLSGSGNRVEPESGVGESLSQFKKWFKHKREINSFYAHGMDEKVLEEIWLFAQNNEDKHKCKLCSLGAVHHYCNIHKPWSPT